MQQYTWRLFDVILSLGFTGKTRLFFTSSNSSFIECVRNYSPSSHILLSPLLSNDCNQGCSDHDFGSTNLTLDDNSSHEFTNCIWTDCSSFDAGAITFRNKQSSHLEVQQCIFTRCTSTYDDHQYSGGAINAYNVHSVTVTASFFLFCSASSRSGGGINLVSIIHQPYIHNCDFIFCSAFQDGGGVEIWLCSAEDNTIVCENCRFISCSVPTNNDNRLGPWAGGILLWDNGNITRCSNLIFSLNEGYCAGAYGTDLNTDAPDFPLRFCFFYSNTATNGNDVCFRHYQGLYATHFFSHCFSATKEERVVVYFSDDYSNWLPLSEWRYTKETRSDMIDE